MKAKLRRLVKVVKSVIPRSLPQSEGALAAWTEDLLEVGLFPNNPSFRVAVATMVLHLDADITRVSQYSLIRKLRRSVANQSAFNIMQDLKKQEQEKAASEQSTEAAPEEVVQEAQG